MNDETLRTMISVKRWLYTSLLYYINQTYRAHVQYTTVALINTKKINNIIKVTEWFDEHTSISTPRTTAATNLHGKKKQSGDHGHGFLSKYSSCLGLIDQKSMKCPK